MSGIYQQNDIQTPPKLVILYRLEPGCLGPDGLDHIEVFCQIAQRALATLNANICYWQLTPRFDKSLAELQYSLAGKTLTRDKAAIYVSACQADLTQLEEFFEDKLTLLINRYIARKIPHV
ncbi:hypothetical protein [Shewanella gaetbuli]|uniref:Orphan protein n=1 Tax=Shewanella gaetbuli TaxID=220752 RepID=A0A9X1ZHP2_9GAMM|nr:hypothetical protein [Shewanella gaetbuli]MCL1142494.1 hypothetical protein [Shewanella gaetbuli]